MAAQLTAREFDIYKCMLDYCKEYNVTPLENIEMELAHADLEKDTYVFKMFTNIRNYHIAQTGDTK